RLGEDIYNGTNLEVKAWQPLTNVLDKISSMGIKTIRAIDTSADKRAITAIWNPEKHYYEKATKKSRYGLPPDETPALTERLQALATQVEAALPSILALTNQLSTFLSNGVQLTSNFNVVAENARPMITNLNVITANLRNPTGSLGEWLIPTNINQQLDTTLRIAQGTLVTVDTNLVTLNRSLDNLGNITSNLNNQVQANSNILSNISQTVVHSDQFIQGLKRFWLFRHLFKTKTKTKAQPARSAQPVQPLSSPREQTR
ncbi:MAG: Mammalian cell entry related domain protein, partial [Pedosphaera sp.]|nr:Mammalian cell entry related domain protein [Pedosphaera sp.]